MRTTPDCLAAAARRLLSFALFTWLLATGFAASAQSTSPNYTALWWNANESGWGLNVVHQGDILFVTKFTYQKAGLGTHNPPTWFFGSDVRKQPDGSYFGQWYQTVGSSFDANPFVPLFAAQVTSVGTIRLTFSGNSGTMTYTVNGTTVTKAITKQVYGVAAASCSFTDNPDRSASTNYQDLWWNSNESGWGVNFTHQHTQDRGEILFATMFNYQKAGQGTHNPPTWLFGSSLVKQLDGSFFGDLYQTTGSAFDASPFVPLTAANLTAVGTMRFTPINGQTGTLTYSVNGVTVVKTVTRQVYQYPVSSCTTVTTQQSSYTDKVYVTYVGAYPYSVTKTGVTKVTNRTQFTFGWFPLFNCSLYEVPIENGIIPVQCTTASDNVRRTFYINPSTNELFQYTGAFIFDSTKWHAVPWGTTMPYGNSVGTQGAYAEVADGIYWGPWGNPFSLLFSPKVGNGYDFNNALTVAQATGVDNFKVIIKYSYTPPASLSYTDKVYAIWTAASPYAVTKTGVTPVTNRTSYTAGNYPIFNCGIANKPLSDGKVLLDCQQRTTLQPRKFYIDPTTDTMYDYNDVVPADITFTFTQAYDPNKPEWSAKAKVLDGWYFTTFDVTWVLKFQYDQGGAVITVKAGTFEADGTVKFLAAYSH